MAQARFDADEAFSKRARETVVELQSGTNPKVINYIMRIYVCSIMQDKSIVCTYVYYRVQLE
jgi:hypothetical protein